MIVLVREDGGEEDGESDRVGPTCGGRGNVVLGSPHPINQGRKLQEGGGPRKGGIRVG